MIKRTKSYFAAIFATLFLLLGAMPVHPASVRETQSFLREHRHAWLPYPFPAETTTNELARLLAYDFDAIGLHFVGSYHDGNIDFSLLDTAINLVTAKNKKVVLHLMPRFDPSDAVYDQLSNGTTLTNQWNINPNATMIDVFDARQRDKFYHYLELCSRRYGHDPRVLGFVVGWGYMGETGFYIGDFLTNFKLLGSVASGYSPNALKEFNRWRRRHDLPELSKLPLPSITGPKRDYVLFHQFRSEFTGQLFQKQAIDRIKSFTRKPVGTFGYISVNVANYGRDWAYTPNADFFRSAAATASFDLNRTLVDSGVGWEDNEFHDGSWNFTLACLQRDIARQITRGAVHHAMPVHHYDVEPQWETNLFPKLAHFLISQKLAREVRPAPATIALFQPTWAAAALPIRSESNPFVPGPNVQHHLSKMAGLAESFGLPYEPITERDLLSPSKLRRYHHIIIPMWDQMPLVLGKKYFTKLSRDPRIVPIPLANKPLSRSEFRKLLTDHQITPRLDFDTEQISAGRVHNLLINWNNEPLTVRVPDQDTPMVLKPMEYRFFDQQNENRRARWRQQTFHVDESNHRAYSPPPNHIESTNSTAALFDFPQFHERDHMPISEHLNSFAGFTVREFEPKAGLQDTANTIYRIRQDPDAKSPSKSSKGILGNLFGRNQQEPPPPASPWEALLADPKCAELKGIVYGYWFKDFDMEAGSEEVITNLSMGAAALPNVQALFIGDITFEECEISWLHQSDVTPLFRAYPRLQHLGVRGSDGLKIGPAKHAELKSLVIQCGGLPAAVLREVFQSEFSALEHLELWLGEGNYGADTSITDLQPLLSGKLFPKLRYLGLRDSEMTDEIAAAIVSSPILQRIETLDLSMGTLSDVGADALLSSPAIARLKKLDLHHHFLSDDKIARLQKLGPQVDLSEKQDADEYDGEEFRYVAVGE